MASLWSFLGKTRNREVMGWIGGGMVTVAVGAWAVVTYVWPSHEPQPACAQQGIAIGGGVSGSTVTNNASGASGSGPCVATSKGK
jgi:hypothetical protein